jgi:quercetin dioxygenase-like cupin family protein
MQLKEEESMKRMLPVVLTSATILTASLAGPAMAQDDHVQLTPDEIAWSPGPGSIPEGAEAAVLYGNPGEEGLFALRLKLPDGYHIAPHFHPRPEIVTVISGTFLIGHGETADPGAADALEPGSFFAFPPGMAHFAYAEGETVIQLNSVGPWGLEYVNPADDPRN